MPALVAHNYFCKEVLASSKKEIQNLIANNTGAFYLGAQGPDIFFTMHFEKNKRKELGSFLHQKKIFEAFNAMAEHAKTEQDPAFTAYLFGYLCHYSLDVSVHPYVRYYEEQLFKIKPMDKKYEKHLRLESGFDLVIIRDLIKGDVRKYRAVKNTLSCTKAEERAIAKYYSEKGAPLYGLDISEKKVVSCIKVTRLFFNFVHDGTKSRLKFRLADRFEDLRGAKKQMTGFMRLKEEAAGEDWCNLRRDKFPETYNSDKFIDSTLFELMDKAKVSALKLFDEVYAAVFHSGALSPESFSITFDGEIATDNNI